MDHYKRQLHIFSGFFFKQMYKNTQGHKFVVLALFQLRKSIFFSALLLFVQITPSLFLVNCFHFCFVLFSDFKIVSLVRSLNLCGGGIRLTLEIRQMPLKASYKV